MAVRTVNYYLMKAIRITGWLLLPLVALYVTTGFTISGGYGLGRFINVNLANELHKLFKWPLAVLFVIHASLTGYFAFRRWGWIKSRKRRQLARRRRSALAKDLPSEDPQSQKRESPPPATMAESPGDGR